MIWVLVAALPALAADIVADAPLAKNWHIDTERAEAVYTGGPLLEPGLPLVVKGFSENPVELRFTTDAASCAVEHGGVTFTFPIDKGKENKLDLWGDKKNFRFNLNGKEMTAERGRWIALFLGANETFVLRFTAGTYVNASWSVAAPADSARSGDVLADVRKSVVMLKTFDSKRQQRGSGSAFYVTAEGFAITNHHVVRSAASMKAIDDSVTPPLEMDVELWAVHPDLDLALVKVAPGQPDAAFQPLAIAQEEPRQGVEVFALGYPLGVGYTVTRGIVNAVRSYDQLPKHLAAPWRKDSRWIQTDCTINPGNSGGPLINTQGQVVGVNTWIWLEGVNMFFALSSTHLKQIIDGRPNSPVGFTAADLPVASDSTVGALPVIEIDRKLKPGDLTRVVNVFEQGMICSQCRGTGETSKEVITGYRTDGVFRRAIVKQVTERCSKCKGNGANSVETLERLLAHIADTVVQLNLNERMAGDAIEYFRSRFQQRVGQFGYQFRTRSAVQLFENEAAVPVRKPVVAIGRLYTISGSGERFRVLAIGEPRVTNVVDTRTGLRWTLQLPERPDRFVIITDAAIGGKIEEGTVIAGGLFAGRLTVGDRQVPVLQGGFIVPVR